MVNSSVIVSLTLAQSEVSALVRKRDIPLTRLISLSPGAEALQELIGGELINDLAQWSTFPAYPTSFIIAANTVIEV